MAAPSNMKEHHIRGETCNTRPTYREGRKQKAVKVYTVNLESKYLLIQGVPAVGTTHELIKLFALHGPIEEYRILDEYPTADQFTDVYLIKFQRIQSARHAKHKLDDWSFFGGVLHVCYAPDYENVDDTREKLQDRRKSVAAKIRQNASNQSQQGLKSGGENLDLNSSCHRSNETPHKERLQTEGQSSSLSTSDFTANKQFFPIKTNAFTQSDQNTGIVGSSSHFKEGTISSHRGTGELSSECNVETDYKINDFQMEEQTIMLPPPPQKGSFINFPHFSHGVTYEYARVPTAHASLPLNYDGRLISEQNLEYRQPVIVHSEQYQSNQNQKCGGKKEWTTDQKEDNSNYKPNSEKNVQLIVIENNNLKKGSEENKIIIRDYKKSGVIPKFIPRQTLNLLKKKEETCDKKETVEKFNADDKVNQELRKNALTLLPKPQGPLSLSGDEPQLPTKGDNSLQQTVTNIRKRMNMISSNIQPPTEKKKKPS